ncbi:MAG: DUF11 domain-containing protein [Chloroflexi bacterium]|nr:DUF11 domain-containing protein [Chloroflexota bacterium]
MRIRYLLTVTAVALGLAFALLWLLETVGGAAPNWLGQRPARAGSHSSVSSDDALERASGASSPALAEWHVCLAGPPTCNYASIQAAVDAASPGDLIKVAAGVYLGVNNYGGLSQAVYVSKTVTIRGGYTTADWSTFDPVANRTTVNAGQAGRVFYVTGNIAPAIEGLRITGGDATGLGGGYPGWLDAGGGIYVITATAVISGNVIANNVASASTTAEGMGGGVFLYRSAAVVVNNEITGNVAGRGTLLAWTSDGTGGGLCAVGGAPRVLNNRIYENQGAVGGLIMTTGSGGGLAFIETRPQVSANQIRQNTAGGDFGAGGGVYLAASPAFTLTNNVIADNQADYSGSGVEIGSMSGVPSRGRLLHNTIARNQTTEGIRVAHGGSVVTATNTILVAHETGINVSFESTATLTATLWGSGGWANTTDWGDVGDLFTGTVNIWGDPAFLNPNAGDYHIAVTSDAIDAGVPAGVGVDMDGEARDALPDIGADELGGRGLQVVKTADPTDLYPGDVVTYAITVTGAGVLGVTHVVLTDTLPALQRPQGAGADRGSCAIQGAGYSGLIVCALGDLDSGQAAHITITAQVTTTEPPNLPQTMRNTALAVGDQAGNSAFADTVLRKTPNCWARVNGALPTYTAVQDAVDAAASGAEIWISGTCLGASERAGLFQHVYLAKNLTLRGGYNSNFTAWNAALYTTTLDAEGQGRVIYVAGPAVVAIEALHLTGGDATGLGGGDVGFGDVGGGLYAVAATVTVSGCQIAGNVASTSFDSFGGGIGVVSATLTVVNAALSENTALSAGFGLGYGGGLSAENSTVRLERVRLEGNQAGPGMPGFGGGSYLINSSLDARASLWLSNTVSAADWGQGGGIFITGRRPFTLTNCVIAGNRADDASGESGSGLWVADSAGALLHPTLARNTPNEGLTVDQDSTVAVANAIIANHAVGIRALAGVTVTVDGVLWFGNAAGNVAGVVQVSHAYTGAPAFGPDGYHLTAASAAIDQGVASGVTGDLDQEARPNGIAADLGADEFYSAAPVLAISRSGNDVLLAWTHDPAFTGYQVWRSTQVYFTPGDNCAAPPAGQVCTVVLAPGSSHTHTGAVADIANNYAYLLLGVSATGQRSSPSNRVAEFGFGLTPGSP